MNLTDFSEDTNPFLAGQTMRGLQTKYAAVNENSDAQFAAQQNNLDIQSNSTSLKESTR